MLCWKVSDPNTDKVYGLFMNREQAIGSIKFSYHKFDIVKLEEDEDAPSANRLMYLHVTKDGKKQAIGFRLECVPVYDEVIHL